MDERGMIERHLAEAEYHVLLGEQHIARQKEIVTELERDGHADAHNARALLATFEQAQKSHVEDCDRLRAELAALVEGIRAADEGHSGMG